MTFNINEFLTSLPVLPSSHRLLNPWRESTPVDVSPHSVETRRKLIANHFDCIPRLLVIGDCVNYYSSLQTGVAFVSEYLVCNEELPRLHTDDRITSTPNVFGAPSIAVLWRVFKEFGVDSQVLCWNALPYQPFQENTHMNRQPTLVELSLGLPWLELLIQSYKGVPIVTIGARARKMVQKITQEYSSLPHLSRGGIQVLRPLLTSILGDTKNEKVAHS